MSHGDNESICAVGQSLSYILREIVQSFRNKNFFQPCSLQEISWKRNYECGKTNCLRLDGNIFYACMSFFSKNMMGLMG